MIKIICFGKLKEKYFKDASNEYLKRISKYTKLEIIELEDIDGDSVKTTLSKERDQVLKYINKSQYLITLEIEGKEMTSPALAEKIDKTLISNSNIVFIIGGSYGIHEDIKKLSNLSLSFSKLTFPHQLFRIILLEQIYRCFKILNNETYHK